MLTHLRATLAYLEVNHQQINASTLLVVAPRKVAEARTYTNGEDCPVQVEHPKRHHQSGRTAGFEFLKTPRSVSLQRRRALRELG